MNLTPSRLVSFFVAIILLIVVTLFTSTFSFWYSTFAAHGAVRKPIVTGLDPQQQSVAFCVLAKDEHDLYEWIDYHRHLGVSKFYLLDENSQQPLSLQIPEFIESGLVEYSKYSFFWTNFMHFLGVQTKNHLRIAFDECLRLHGHKHSWIGFFDADEYVILKDTNQQSLPKFLMDYGQYGGVVLNWMLFGSSGHVTRPKGGILKNYYRCIPNGTVKTIVQPKHTVGTGGNCHYFTYKEPYYAVNGNFNRIDGHWASPEALDAIYLNHYKMKSLADFNAKLIRWGKTLSGGTYRANLSPNLLNEMDNMMTQNCSIPKFNRTKEYE